MTVLIRVADLRASAGLRGSAKSLALSAILVACGCKSSPTQGDSMWSHRAAVQGQVLTQGNAPLAGAIVVVRVPPNSRGAYNMPDTKTDQEGRFTLTVVRAPTGLALPPEGPDTVDAYVVASGGPELPDGGLPTDSVRVTLSFAPRQAPLPPAATVSVHVPVP